MFPTSTLVHCMVRIPDINSPHGRPGAADLDLNLLVALDALLGEANVTRAAARIGLSQSAMSHKLRRLRDQFDDPLLVATRGGMALTPYAEQLVGPLRHALRQLHGVWTGPRPFEPATSDREFVIVSSDFAEFEILPRVFGYTTQHAPHVRCRMRTAWPGLLSALEAGTVDLVMGPSMPPQLGLVQRRVAEDELRVIVRRDHPAVGETMDLDTYLCLPHLLTQPEKLPGAASPVIAAAAAIGKQLRVAMTIPHLIGGPFIVAKSDLVLTTSRALAEAAAKILPLRVLDPPLPLPCYGVFMTWHERFTRDPGHQWLRELAARITAEVVDFN
jgi:DNA-binding transcriptional LysR family regulator